MLALKNKLEIFQARFEKLEEERMLREQANKTDGLQEKIWAMEAKLEKITKRKSVMFVQEQMQKLQQEIQLVRSNNSENVNDRVEQLQRQMEEIQHSKVVVNDAETRQLQSHIRKLEEKMRESEQLLKGMISSLFIP